MRPGDNNCDGLVDPDDAEDASTWYRDEDLDGFGDANDTVVSCDLPTGYIGNSDDCDDTLPLVNPDGVEVCNSIDDDCNGMTDEDMATYYRDDDGDGRGDPDGAWVHCTRPLDTSRTIPIAMTPTTGRIPTCREFD